MRAHPDEATSRKARATFLCSEAFSLSPVRFCLWHEALQVLGHSHTDASVATPAFDWLASKVLRGEIGPTFYDGDLPDVMAMGLPFPTRVAYLRALSRQSVLAGSIGSLALRMSVDELFEHMRLRKALEPFVWTIKARACERLDCPPNGRRFRREHGVALDAL